MTDNPEHGDGEAGEVAVIIERTVTAPIELVWQMWTESEHFASWYGPQGATIPTATMEVEVGGTRHICMEMQTPDGSMQMWFVGEYLEVDAPTRLVYTESMSDAEGNVVSAAEMGMPGDHPDVTRVTVELEATGTATRMVLTHAGIPADSPGAMGWNMALDKLEERLATLQ